MQPADPQLGSPPSLQQLCLVFIENCIVNCENVLFFYDFSQIHHIPALLQRCDRFVMASWPGIRAQHSPEECASVLGEQRVDDLDKEYVELQHATSKMKMLGSVVDTPVQPPAWDLTPRRRALSAPLAPSAEPAPAPRSFGNVGVAASAGTSVRAPRRSFGGGGDKCAKCEKTVYAAEKLAVHGSVYHTNCFRCSECACKLGMHNFEKGSSGTLLCKTHFAQVVSRHGTVASLTRGPATEAAAAAVDAIGGPSTSQLPPVPLPAAPATGVGAAAVAAAAPAPAPAAAVLPVRGLPAWVASAAERCERCNKIVYAVERQTAELINSAQWGVNSAQRGVNSETLVFHRQCFRCYECNTVLRAGNFELRAQDRVLLCKVHFAARQALAEQEAAV